MTDDLNKIDELVDIKLPREEAQILRAIIKERETYNFIVNKIKSNMIWIIASGCLAVLALWEKFQALFNGIVK